MAVKIILLMRLELVPLPADLIATVMRIVRLHDVVRSLPSTFQI